ncbi:MAG TPA: TIGR03619 family F420-dependent LLM class oxidoreductase [Acidimicrobiales bacterium]|nr:TIGR03619 family F420-dependent LLM class oxidoreductase [Acidimicrobiales bacterium]
MNYWLVLPLFPPEELVPIAREAEAAGFAGVALGDHASNPQRIASQYPYGMRRGTIATPGGNKILSSPMVLIAGLSGVTSVLRFMTFVLVVPLRHPILLAKEISTAARLATGRLDLGIGIGWLREEFEALGLDPSSRAQRTDEMMKIMQKLWQGDFVESHTELLRFEPNQVLPTLSHHLPIIVGGNSPSALRRAAKIGDGWVGAYCGLEELSGMLRLLDDERHRANRDHMDFEVRLSLKEPPTPDICDRLEKAGVDGLIVNPGHLTEDSESVDGVLDGLTRFGRERLR